jgi:hypothetical protein
MNGRGRKRMVVEQKAADASRSEAEKGTGRNQVYPILGWIGLAPAAYTFSGSVGHSPRRSAARRAMMR